MFHYVIKTLFILVCVLITTTLAICLYLFNDVQTTHLNTPPPMNVINDVTQLNPVQVNKIITPITTHDIIKAIKQSEGPISIGGGRFSQGGQTALTDSLHLDMRQFNKIIQFDPLSKKITVQSGITWHELITYIDKYDLSVRIMQSYANFTVGGSLSVNVHGRYIGEGPIIRSVDSIELVLADGNVVKASAHQNNHLFYAAIGGYGGIGVISEVTLNLTDNVKVKRFTHTMPANEYAEYFMQHVRDNHDIVFHNGDLYPPEYNVINSVSWHKSLSRLTQTARVHKADQAYSWQPKIANFVASSDFGKWARQTLLEPAAYQFDAVQWRNYEASYDVKELEPSTRETHTYGLREYFVPIRNFDRFREKMAKLFKRYDVNVINVSVRHALADPGSFLAWANTEVFAFVVYYRQGTDDAAKKHVAKWSRALIDAAIEENGTYYLPYQRHASTAQFLKAYPNAKSYFEVKATVDPNNRFTNQLLQQHYHDQGR